MVDDQRDDHRHEAGVSNRLDGPADLRGAHLGQGNVVNHWAPHQSSEPPKSAPGPTYDGETKAEVCARLVNDWRTLADLLEIHPAVRARFPRGWEPHAIWEKLELDGELDRLRWALSKMRRADLLEVLEKARRRP